MRDLLTATLSLPDDSALLYEGDLGQRLRKVTFGSRLNAGFETLTCSLLGRGLELMEEAEAEEITERWRFGLLRVYLAGESVWSGRIEELDYEILEDGSCPFHVGALGLYSLLTDASPASVPTSYTAEDASSSATQLVQDLISANASLLATTFAGLQNTGTNLGQISVSDQDAAIDLIVNALTAGGSGDATYALLIEEREDGPKLIPIGVGEPQWRLLMRGSGLRRGWRGSEYAYQVSVTHSDGNGSSAAIEPVQDATALALNGGVHRSAVISLSGMSADAATAGARAYLAQHGNPVALLGSLKARTIQTAEGRTVPAWRMRAGHLVHLPDFRRFDPDAGTRVYAVEATSYDVDAGELTVTFDQRPVRSRLAEDASRLVPLRRALEPGLSHNILLDVFEEPDTAIDIPIATDTRINEDDIMLTFPRNTKLHVRVALEVVDQGVSTGDSTWQIGYALDGEDWDNTDRTMRSTVFIRNGLNGDTTTLEGNPSPRQISAGQHSLTVYARAAAGAYEVSAMKVFIKA